MKNNIQGFLKGIRRSSQEVSGISEEASTAQIRKNCSQNNHILALLSCVDVFISMEWESE